MQAQSPKGPGFPRREPSVNTTAVPSPQLSRIPPIISLDICSCSPVLDLEDPRIFQYSGFCLLGCNDSK